MKTIKVFTDASCNKITRTSAWGAVILYPNNNFNVMYGVDHNIMSHTYYELFAVLNSIRCLEKEKYIINIYSDYELIYNAFENDLFSFWKENNWKKGHSRDLMYADLWKELAEYYQHKKIKINWIKAHCPENYANCAVDSLVNGLCKHKGDISKINWNKFYQNINKELYGELKENKYDFYKKTPFFAA